MWWRQGINTLETSLWCGIEVEKIQFVLLISAVFSVSTSAPLCEEKDLVRIDERESDMEGRDTKLKPKSIT